MILGRMLLVSLLAVMVILLLGAVRVKEEKICSGIEIQIGHTDQKGFIGEREIKKVITKALNGEHKTILNTPIKQFSLGQTERVLEQNIWIKKAQLFFDNNEVLYVQVDQRIPVARILDLTGSSYYLDSTGFRLPLSNAGRADVPVFTNVPETPSVQLRQVIINMANYIRSDSFWLAQAAQIQVVSNDKFELYPAFGNHVVDLGNGLNPADKFGRLKLFYKTVSSRIGMDAYPRLSVAFSGQVVAVKAKSVAKVDAIKAMQAFDQMVKANRHTANDEKIQEEFKQKITKRDAVSVTGNNVKTGEGVSPGGKQADNTGEDKKGQQRPKAVMPKFNNN